MNNIHPTAIISRKANLGKNITIGPYCIINNEAVSGTPAVKLKNYLKQSIILKKMVHKNE